MGNEFDKEMSSLSEPAPQERNVEDSSLASLERHLSQSQPAAGGRVKCECRQEELSLSVDGQVVGIWKQQSDQLALYRPGLDRPDCVASGTAEAAKLSARLVAAFAQA